MDWKRRIRLGRETLGVLLLVVLLLLGLFCTWDMDRTHTAISRELEDAAWFGLAENWEAARIACAAAESKWEQHRTLSSLVADHSPMEQIDALFAQANAFSAARSSADFAAVCSELSRYVQTMGEAHRLNWKNVL